MEAAELPAIAAPRPHPALRAGLSRAGRGKKGRKTQNGKRGALPCPSFCPFFAIMQRSPPTLPPHAATSGRRAAGLVNSAEVGLRGQDFGLTLRQRDQSLGDVRRRE